MKNNNSLLLVILITCSFAFQSCKGRNEAQTENPVRVDEKTIRKLAVDLCAPTETLKTSSITAGSSFKDLTTATSAKAVVFEHEGNYCAFTLSSSIDGLSYTGNADTGGLPKVSAEFKIIASPSYASGGTYCLKNSSIWTLQPSISANGNNSVSTFNFSSATDKDLYGAAVTVKLIADQLLPISSIQKATGMFLYSCQAVK